MLAYEGAVAIARKHLEGIRPPTGRRWRAPEGHRVAGGWFFGYTAELIRPRRREYGGFACAPGTW